jgi:Domain of unknown function (DUF4351)
MEEKLEFDAELEQLVPQEKEGVMEIVTSWMEEGLEKGLSQGLENERKLVLRQLRTKLGDLGASAVAQIETLPRDLVEELGEALLGFAVHSDLDDWLQSHRS